MTELRTSDEHALTKQLLDTAAALGKILHARGGHVKISIALSGPKRGLSPTGKRRAKQILKRINRQ